MHICNSIMRFVFKPQRKNKQLEIVAEKKFIYLDCSWTKCKAHPQMFDYSGLMTLGYWHLLGHVSEETSFIDASSTFPWFCLAAISSSSTVQIQAIQASIRYDYNTNKDNHTYGWPEFRPAVHQLCWLASLFAVTLPKTNNKKPKQSQTFLLNSFSS